jgi:catechol 2,3-dioxygenase
MSTQSVAPSKPTPKPRLTHFALFVKDIVEMEKFYTEVVGLTPTDRGPFPNPDVDVEMVFMSSDPKEHHQFVLCTGRPDNIEFHLNQQMSFLVENLAELREVRDRAKAVGVGEIRTRTHGNAWSIYFTDLEGNGIETYLHSPWYIPQPHSFEFDLDQTDDEIMKFTEDHCRADPGFMMASEREAKMAAMMGL